MAATAARPAPPANAPAKTPTSDIRNAMGSPLQAARTVVFHLAQTSRRSLLASSTERRKKSTPSAWVRPPVGVERAVVAVEHAALEAGREGDLVGTGRATGRP